MGREKNLNSMINESMKFPKRKQSMNSMINDEAGRVEYVADRLVTEYSAPDSHKFFLKAAWHLSEAFIWKTVEISRSTRITNSLRYFIHCCSNEMKKAK